MLSRVIVWVNYREETLRIDRKDYTEASDILMEAYQRHEVRILQTTETKIREGLIALGWTPPPAEASDADPTI